MRNGRWITSHRLLCSTRFDNALRPSTALLRWWVVLGVTAVWSLILGPSSGGTVSPWFPVAMHVARLRLHRCPVGNSLSASSLRCSADRVGHGASAPSQPSSSASSGTQPGPTNRVSGLRQSGARPTSQPCALRGRCNSRARSKSHTMPPQRNALSGSCSPGSLCPCPHCATGIANLAIGPGVRSTCLEANRRQSS